MKETEQYEVTPVYLHLLVFNEMENGLKNLHSTQIQLQLEQEASRLGCRKTLLMRRKWKNRLLEEDAESSPLGIFEKVSELLLGTI